MAEYLSQCSGSLVDAGKEETCVPVSVWPLDPAALFPDGWSLLPIASVALAPGLILQQGKTEGDQLLNRQD